MDDEALIQYKNVEIHQQELCVLSDVNLELHKFQIIIYSTVCEQLKILKDNA